MASVPSYALAGLLKGRRQSSEAALKYAVYGAGAAGIMLYGVSLLAGLLGSVHLPTMAVRLAELLSAQVEHGASGGTNMVLALGGLMIMVGVAFKLSAVPFHFWCPDVFEGATAEVDAFLSVASKAAALALLVRVAVGFGYIPTPSNEPAAVAVLNVAEQTAADRAATADSSSQGSAPSAAAESDRAQQLAALAPARTFTWQLLAFVAVITCTFGNLAAYGQTNIKRMLAYSTIAQAGYMIMPVPAAMALAGADPEAARAALGAMAFYAGVYLFMNLGAFAIVAFLRNTLHSEEIADYSGLIRRSPLVVVCFATILISLIGLPPLAGFVGKLQIFYYLVQSGLWVVLVVAGLNTVISLIYYLRVVKIMTIDPEPENRIAEPISFVPATYVVLVTLPLVFLGIWWNGLTELATSAASQLF
jgi:NADH-quinone oxidoreductase subunit N